MTFFLRIITGYFLLALVFFYSAGILNFQENKNLEIEKDCRLRKDCPCCSMNVENSCCCCNHSTVFRLNIDIPCDHPLSKEMNFKTDSSILIDIELNKSFVTEQKYLYHYSATDYYIEQSLPLKPPNTNLLHSA